MTCFRGDREEFYCEVLLLDESKIALTAEQGIKKSTKGSTILQLIFDRINLAEIDYFGLRYCDRHHQTHWLDASKTLSQHQHLISTGPPYTLYFGVKFYAEDPCKLKEEITRYQFFLQVRQDILQGRLPCPADTTARLTALALQGNELGDYDAGDHKQALDEEVQLIYQTLSGTSHSEAESLYLSLAKTLDMYGVDLHPVYGEHQSEYFLGLTPVGVVVYKNRVQVGKYFWPRISKVHFKDTQFELRVVGKDGSETSFVFGAVDRKSCKQLWRSCVEFHSFFRMSSGNEANTLTRKLSKLGSKHRYSGRVSSQLRASQDVVLPRQDVIVVRKPSKKLTHSSGKTNKTQNADQEETLKLTSALPVNSSKPATVEEEHHGKPSAPWEGNGTQSGLYGTSKDRTRSPKFPAARVRTPLTDGNGERRRRLSQDDGDRPNRLHRRRSRSRGNTSSGSESENSSSVREHRKKKERCQEDNDLVDSAPQWEAVQRRQRERAQRDSNVRRSRHRSRSRSPDVQAKEQLWKHIQTELVDPVGLSEEQLREIPYKKVETQGDPVKLRHAHSPRGSRQHRRSPPSEANTKTDLVPPLPVTRTTDTVSQV
ncbi:LOW QUALITY PROTEIN: band 4.1-like protein 4 [Lampris incognitus]|uniref:LOW QUALITY PROTEIN: band 4.1-like protein 4 n=1 Tax=Lampris incognitus TaxID=2546036 RepID=UPI0024B4F73C|nr:LOW QUALITY PROTEIN: band 4.1-like protein 4 [Lampris incognitus]